MMTALLVILTQFAIFIHCSYANTWGFHGGLHSHKAIVNGERVNGSSYPWMASLRAVYPGFTFEENTAVDYYSRFCGGSLISLNPITILTAAHCVDFFGYDDAQNSITEGGDLINLYVDLGRTKGPHLHNNYDESGDNYTTLTVPDLSSIHIHAKWNTTEVSDGYDIAVIIINDSQTLPANYTHAHIPSDKEITEQCCTSSEMLTAIGYGLDDDEAQSGEPTDTLERITMEYHPSEECVEFMWTFSGNSLPVPASIDRPPNDQVCARGDNADICQGDSGGPLFRTLNNGTIEVVGISSYVMGSETDKCNSVNPNSMPSFFSSVSHYNRWINAMMAGEAYEYVQDSSDDDVVDLSTYDDYDLFAEMKEEFGIFLWIGIAVIAFIMLITCSVCVYCIVSVVVDTDE